MTTTSLTPEWVAAADAFDALAHTYDVDFTQAFIGRAQRNQVWEAAQKIFCSGDILLELNCGTGEDALFFSRNHISVVACDASPRMIATAQQRARTETLSAPVRFYLLPTEQLEQFKSPIQFDGVFSNFSGLNCVHDLNRTARDLAARIRPGGSMLLCLSTRICIAEIVYYLLRANPRKALRRLSGHTHATLSGHTVDVYYPTLRELRRTFSPDFDLLSVQGIGVAIPPSYMERHIQRHPRLFRALCKLEPLLARLPILRTTGDHMLLHLQKRSA